MAYTTINKGSSYFNTVLYAGNDTGQSITTGFANDFVWIKDRGGTDSHTLFDVIRTPLQRVITNLTDAESTLAGSLTAFNSNGFTLGNSDNVNDIGHNFVSWNWLAGGTGVSNTAGSISATVSANTTAGFSIVSYTGNGTGTQTVGHGLGAVPKMFIIKSRTTAVNWRVYHASVGNTAGLALNTTGASDTNSGFFQNTTPTSTVFTLGDGSTVNGSGANYIAYCFAEVKGYSKFGSYTGNGSTDGTFIYTGFKPAFFIVKCSNTTFNWIVEDNKRNTFNVVDKYLLPNTNDAEGTVTLVDFLSNGIKMRTTDNSHNGSGNTYIYMAFAENPFVTSGGIPITAR